VKIRALAAIGAATALLLTGCGGGSSGSSAAPASAAPAAAPKTLTVQAAASLTETFTALGKQFETDHPGVSVKFNYAGSSDLAQQIVNGAPADVFAAATGAFPPSTWPPCGGFWPPARTDGSSGEVWRTAKNTQESRRARPPKWRRNLRRLRFSRSGGETGCRRSSFLS